MRKLVIIPTYNEIANISPMIDKVMSLSGAFDLLIIDDLGTELSNGCLLYTSPSPRDA